MSASATTPDQYIAALPPGRREAVASLWRTIREHLPPGFEETMAHGMIAWVVPHGLYPAGYHADPKQPLPFMSLASQSRHIALHHMGLYADAGLLAWFRQAYVGQGVGRLDMGKSCIRWRKPEQIPHALIGELAAKITPMAWIERYERERGRG